MFEVKLSAEQRIAKEVKKCSCSHCRFIVYRALQGQEAKEFLGEK